jgi:hypothetical protein
MDAETRLRFRRMFFPTEAELAVERAEREARESEQRKLEAMTAEMGHADAVWVRLTRRWSNKIQSDEVEKKGG